MKCEKCNHEYSDDLPTCPVCGEANPRYVAKDDSEKASESDDAASSGTQSGKTRLDKNNQAASGSTSTNSASSGSYSWNNPGQQSNSANQHAQTGSNQQNGGSSQYSQNYGNQQGGYGQNYGNQQGGYGQNYGNQQGGYGQNYGNRQGGYGQNYGNQQYYGPQVPAKTNKTAVAVLVLGIISLIIPLAGFITGIIAIVLGNKAKADCMRGTTDYAMANAGWIMGIVGVVLQGVVIVLVITALTFASSVISAAMPYEWWHWIQWLD